MKITPRVRLGTAAREAVAQPPTSVSRTVWNWKNNTSIMEVIYYILPPGGTVLARYRKIILLDGRHGEGTHTPSVKLIPLNSPGSSSGFPGSSPSFPIHPSSSDCFFVSFHEKCFHGGYWITQETTTAVPKRWPSPHFFCYERYHIPRGHLCYCHVFCYQITNPLQKYSGINHDPKAFPNLGREPGVPTMVRSPPLRDTALAATGTGAEGDVRR